MRVGAPALATGRSLHVSNALNVAAFALDFRIKNYLQKLGEKERFLEDGNMVRVTYPADNRSANTLTRSSTSTQQQPGEIRHG